MRWYVQQDEAISEVNKTFLTALSYACDMVGCEMSDLEVDLDSRTISFNVPDDKKEELAQLIADLLS